MPTSPSCSHSTHWPFESPRYPRYCSYDCTRGMSSHECPSPEPDRPGLVAADLYDAAVVAPLSPSARRSGRLRRNQEHKSNTDVQSRSKVDVSLPAAGPFTSMDSSISGGSQSHGIDLDAQASRLADNTPRTSAELLQGRHQGYRGGKSDDYAAQEVAEPRHRGLNIGTRRLRRQDESPLILSPALAASHPMSPFNPSSRVATGGSTDDRGVGARGQPDDAVATATNRTAHAGPSHVASAAVGIPSGTAHAVTKPILSTSTASIAPSREPLSPSPVASALVDASPIGKGLPPSREPLSPSPVASALVDASPIGKILPATTDAAAGGTLSSILPLEPTDSCPSAASIQKPVHGHVDSDSIDAVAQGSADVTLTSQDQQMSSEDESTKRQKQHLCEPASRIPMLMNSPSTASHPSKQVNTRQSREVPPRQSFHRGRMWGSQLDDESCVSTAGVQPDPRAGHGGVASGHVRDMQVQLHDATEKAASETRRADVAAQELTASREEAEDLTALVGKLQEELRASNRRSESETKQRLLLQRQHSHTRQLALPAHDGEHLGHHTEHRARLQAQVTGLQADVIRLTQEKDDATARTESSADQVEALRAEIEALNRQLSKKDAALEIHAKQMQATDKKCRDTEQALVAERDVSSTQRVRMIELEGLVKAADDRTETLLAEKLATESEFEQRASTVRDDAKKLAAAVDQMQRELSAEKDSNRLEKERAAILQADLDRTRSLADERDAAVTNALQQSQSQELSFKAQIRKIKTKCKEAVQQASDAEQALAFTSKQLLESETDMQQIRSDLQVAEHQVSQLTKQKHEAYVRSRRDRSALQRSRISYASRGETSAALGVNRATDRDVTTSSSKDGPTIISVSHAQIGMHSATVGSKTGTTRPGSSPSSMATSGSRSPPGVSTTHRVASGPSREHRLRSELKRIKQLHDQVVRSLRDARTHNALLRSRLAGAEEAISYARDARKSAAQAGRRSESMWKSRWTKACMIVLQLLGQSASKSDSSEGKEIDSNTGQTHGQPPQVSPDDLIELVRIARAEMTPLLRYGSAGEATGIRSKPDSNPPLHELLQRAQDLVAPLRGENGSSVGVPNESVPGGGVDQHQGLNLNEVNTSVPDDAGLEFDSPRSDQDDGRARREHLAAQQQSPALSDDLIALGSIISPPPAPTTRSRIKGIAHSSRYELSQLSAEESSGAQELLQGIGEDDVSFRPEGRPYEKQGTPGDVNGAELLSRVVNTGAKLSGPASVGAVSPSRRLGVTPGRRQPRSSQANSAYAAKSTGRRRGFR